MTWEVLVPLIAKYGIPAAYEMWKIIRGGPPSDEAWQKLVALVNKPLSAYIEEAKAKNEP